MATRRISHTKPKLKSNSSTREPLFGPAPILEGEDSRAYDELLLRVSSDVKPSDIFEDIWIRDVVDHTWEILRLRRIKTNLLNEKLQSSLSATLESLVPGPERDCEATYMYLMKGIGDPPPPSLAMKWSAKDPKAIAQGDKILRAAGLDMEAAIAQFSRRSLRIWSVLIAC